MKSITLNNITIEYEGKPLLQDLNLAIPPGKISCLLGRSGSGKTTILKIIAGIISDFKGEVYFDNENVTQLPAGKRLIGWIPQQQLLFPGLSVRENISYGLMARKVSQDIQNTRIEEISELVGLENILDRSTEKLSGGEKQRVAIARALITQPSILLLDEPFSSLDAPERDRLTLALREIQMKTGTTAIHVTHSPREAELIADEVFVLHKGSILQHGKMQDLLYQPNSIEVARLLSVPNVVNTQVFDDFDSSSFIIPPASIILGIGENIATIIAITQNQVFLRYQSIQLVANLPSDLGHEFNPGSTINIDFRKDQFNLLDKSKNPHE